eukprot:CAMPEP_0197936468 /NCGR_PEP_ID=MMETSP1439-20131203/114963_1 /TAXON_ID=66791 /ORGANISM="Gonyaulax spinifera, Strain CCMP409" /LENGTH=56 /DNA_ID=CAMNT_0043559443 /DNA_START=51 /DNA_END=217 /DNA_ORIENTATION=+
MARPGARRLRSISSAFLAITSLAAGQQHPADSNTLLQAKLEVTALSLEHHSDKAAG